MKSHFSQLYVSTPAATASLWVTVFKEWLTVEKDAKAWFSYGWCGWSVFINFLRKWKFSPNFFFIEHTLCLISFLLEAFIKNESITPCPTPRKKKEKKETLQIYIRSCQVWPTASFCVTYEIRMVFIFLNGRGKKIRRRIGFWDVKIIWNSDFSVNKQSFIGTQSGPVLCWIVWLLSPQQTWIAADRVAHDAWSMSCGPSQPACRLLVYTIQEMGRNASSSADTALWYLLLQDWPTSVSHAFTYTWSCPWT